MDQKLLTADAIIMTAVNRNCRWSPEASFYHRWLVRMNAIDQHISIEDVMTYGEAQQTTRTRFLLILAQ